MNPLSLEWIEKAEGDFYAAGLLLRARKHPNYDASCFHAQQCAEKYMKAVLTEAGKDVEKVHDLPALLNQLTAVNPAWEVLRPPSTVLTDYAVRFRYPGSSADKTMAREAFRYCQLIRDALRAHFGLPTATGRRSKKRKTVRRIR